MLGIGDSERDSATPVDSQLPLSLLTEANLLQAHSERSEHMMKNSQAPLLGSGDIP